MIRSSLGPVQVVCTRGRREYARLVRSFCRGEITNVEYEEAFDNLCCCDDAVYVIHNRVVWHLYCDLSTHRLTGRHKLNRATRREVARAVLFLRTSEACADAWDRSFGCWYFVGWLAVLASLALGSVFVSPLIGVAATAGYGVWLLVLCARALDPDTSQDAGSEPETCWPFISDEAFA
ncbi:MAG: hypothetical protein AAF235_03215, partial [Planctomycetota bacterium]